MIITPEQAALKAQQQFDSLRDFVQQAAQDGQRIDTMELCGLIGIEKKDFIDRMRKARNYSPYRSSIFEAQISRESYGYLEEKLYKFPGFFVQSRTLRKYNYPVAAHTMGYIGEVGPDVIQKNPYYKSGDYIGISGIEKSYEEILRGKKGMKIQVVDVFNRPKGSFQEGKYDSSASAGTLNITHCDAADMTTRKNQASPAKLMPLISPDAPGRLG